MARRVAVVFLPPAFLCLHYAHALASRGLGGWGWFLFVGMVFWGVVLNALTETGRDHGGGKPTFRDDGWE